MHKGLFLFFTIQWMTQTAVFGQVISYVNVATLHDGDIIFQTSTSPQSLAIRLATRSKFNHMGLIFFRRGKPFVLEAIGTVRYTPLHAWIKRGIPSSYQVMRLKNATRRLNVNALRRLRHHAERMLGKKYDPAFHWSDRRMYCSELVWKAYYRALHIKLGALKPLRSFNINNPLVAFKLRPITLKSFRLPMCIARNNWNQSIPNPNR